MNGIEEEHNWSSYEEVQKQIDIQRKKIREASGPLLVRLFRKLISRKR